MNKITKKNSILYNQLWIMNAIEDARMDLIPVKNQYSKYSIGEIIEKKYEIENEREIKKLYQYGYGYQNEKITKKNSLLYTKEWILKVKEEKKEYLIPKHEVNGYSLGEMIALRYFEEQVLKNRNKENILKLKREKSEV